MGKILKISNKEGSVEVTLEMAQKEIEFLRGEMNKMHIFSENNLDLLSRLVQRGRRESTRYFLMPKDFKDTAETSNAIPCTRIETKSRYIYMFSVNKT